jgi:hypothetical protein
MMHTTTCSDNLNFLHFHSDPNYLRKNSIVTNQIILEFFTDLPNSRIWQSTTQGMPLVQSSESRNIGREKFLPDICIVGANPWVFKM